MNVLQILASLEMTGHVVRVEGDTLKIRPGISADEAERLRPLKPQIIATLRERRVLTEYSFTRGGKLCSRCRALGRVAVIGGDLVCTFCVVAEQNASRARGSEREVVAISPGPSGSSTKTVRRTKVRMPGDPPDRAVATASTQPLLVSARNGTK